MANNIQSATLTTWSKYVLWVITLVFTAGMTYVNIQSIDARTVKNADGIDDNRGKIDTLRILVAEQGVMLRRMEIDIKDIRDATVVTPRK
jgi:hypothetical protein